MSNTQSKEKILFRLKKSSIAMFFITLAGGVGMLVYGASNGGIVYVNDGQTVAMTSAVFLVIWLITKAKLKKLGI